MPKSKYKKKVKNGYTYFFYRYRDDRLPSGCRDLYGRAVKELKEKIKKLEETLDQNIVNSEIRFGEYMNNYLEEVLLQGKAASTTAMYRCFNRKYIQKNSISNIKVKKLNASVLQKYLNGLSRNGASQTTIRKVMSILKSGLHYAFVERILPVDYSTMLVVPSGEKKSKRGRRPARALSIDEEKRLIPVCMEHGEYGLIIVLSLFTGLRRGEAIALKWDDIDFEKKTISITKSYDSIGHKITAPKTKGSVRTIPMVPAVEKLLTNHKIEQNKTRLKFGPYYNNQNFVFASEKGDPLAPATVLANTKRIGRRAGIYDLIFHDFRKTFATRNYEKNPDFKTLAAILGHSKISTTADIYTQVSDDKKSEFLNANFAGIDI